jgi:cytochrome P450
VLSVSVSQKPWQFDPTRFLDGSASGADDSAKDPFAYVPFSAGSRNCIGRVFALLEEKVVIATLFKRFTVSVPKDQRVFLDAALVLRPLDGKLLITVRRR